MNRALALCTCALALASTTLSTPAAEAGAPVRVEIRNFAFAPQTITVPAGTRVSWINRDEEPHTVTSAGGLFKSSLALDTGDTYTATFAKPGTYAYYCSVHPMMVATVVVR